MGVLLAGWAAFYSGGWPLLLTFDAALLAAWLMDARRIPRTFLVERAGPSRSGLGEPNTIVLKIRAFGPARAVLLDEPPPLLVPPEPAELPLPIQLVNGTVEARYEIRSRRRGVHEFGQANLLVEGPWGLMTRRIRLVPNGLQVHQVYPDLGPIDHGALDPQLLMAELGLKRSRQKSEGTEFEAIRDAVPEDELRRIDWRATARRGKWMARTYAHEKNHELLLCLDTGRLMGGLHRLGDEREAGVYRTKLDCALQTALRLTSVALQNGDRVGVLSFDTQVGVFVGPDKGKAQLGRIMEAIFALEPRAADASYFRALLEIGRRQKKRALLLFLTDFVDPQASQGILESLAILSRKHAIVFVALRDPYLRIAADAAVTDLAGVYRSLTALGLEASRAELLRGLAHTGVRALDLTPEEASVGAIQAYLTARAREG